MESLSAVRFRANSSLALTPHRLLFIDLVVGLGAHFRGPVLSVGHGDLPRPAADLAVLDVLLLGPAAGIEGDLDGLAAIGAGDLGGGVGRAIAEGEFLVEGIGGGDHGRKVACYLSGCSAAPSWSPRSYRCCC